MDIRFILLVSVGLMVRAPSPVAWEAWPVGMMDARRPEDGVNPAPPGSGDLEVFRCCSGVSEVLVKMFVWLTTGEACATDLALALLVVVAKLRVVSPLMSREVLVMSLAFSEKRLGRRFEALRVTVSASATTPGPIDFRGGLGAAPEPETGGYWFWRRARTPIVAVEASMEPDVVEIDEALFCLDALGLWRMDPDLVAREDEAETPTRVALPLGLTAVLSDNLLSAMLDEDSTSLRDAAGEGYLCGLNSPLDAADSMLVWRSSKLTEGRKS